MPDILYEMVDRNISKDVKEKISHRVRNQETPGDVENALKKLGFTGILDDKLWVQVRPKLRRMSLVWESFALLEQLLRQGTRPDGRLVRQKLQPSVSLDEVSSGYEK